MPSPSGRFTLASFLVSTFAAACAGVLPAATSAPVPTLTPRAALPAVPPDSYRPTLDSPYFQTPEYGIQVFTFWHEDIGARDLDLVNEMGFAWVKQGFGWRDIELKKGHYDWSRADRVVAMVEERGLKLLARLDYQPFWAQEDGGALPLDTNAPPKNPQDFGDYCRAIAGRYQGRIRAYQVWNEPNLAFEWGFKPADPERYVRLLAACYVGIKSADPDAVVISAGPAPTGTNDPAVAMPDDTFIRRMYEAGGANYFDVLGVHAGYLNPPERSPDEVEADPQWRARWTTFRRVEDIRQIMIEYGDQAKQMAILEMGWTTDTIHPEYAWFAVTEEQQADYLVRAYRYAREHWSPWVGLMVTIFIADPAWTEQNEQFWFAISRPSFPDSDLRPAYEALKEMEK
jgi:polysaccharide biosynthesis protein PslG